MHRIARQHAADREYQHASPMSTGIEQQEAAEDEDGASATLAGALRPVAGKMGRGEAAAILRYGSCQARHPAPELSASGEAMC